MRSLSYLSIISPAELKLKAEQMGTVKGIVHPKMKMFSSFTHPKVVGGLHQLSGYQHSSKYTLCSTEERNSYRFGKT